MIALSLKPVWTIWLVAASLSYNLKKKKKRIKINQKNIKINLKDINKATSIGE